jgi:hypothetical protein
LTAFENGHFDFTKGNNFADLPTHPEQQLTIAGKAIIFWNAYFSNRSLQAGSIAFYHLTLLKEDKT